MFPLFCITQHTQTPIFAKQTNKQTNKLYSKIHNTNANKKNKLLGDYKKQKKKQKFYKNLQRPHRQKVKKF